MSSQRTRRFSLSLFLASSSLLILLSTTPISRAHRIYVWGRGGTGALGLGDLEDQLSPVLLGDGYVRIWTGYNNHFALDDEGDLYCWGVDSQGQCGCGSSPPPDGDPLYQSTPCRVAIPSEAGPILDVVPGSRVSYARTEARGWYGWGRNGGVDELVGLGDDGTGEEALRTPVPLPKFNEEGNPAVSIQAGSNHGVAVMADGEVRTWGKNNFGQLGRGAAVADNPEPTAVPSGGFVEGIPVSCVAAGSRSHVLTDAGRIYTFGLGSDTLGLGLFPEEFSGNQETPAVLTPDEPATFNRLLVGEFSVGAISTTNELFTWGLNSQYRTGSSLEEDGDPVDVGVPTRVPLGVLVKNDDELADVSLGFYTLMGHTEDGLLFGAGSPGPSTSDSKLLLVSSVLKSPQELPWESNVPSDFQAGKILDAAANIYSSVVLVEGDIEEPKAEFPWTEVALYGGGALLIVGLTAGYVYLGRDRSNTRSMGYETWKQDELPSEFNAETRIMSGALTNFATKDTGFDTPSAEIYIPHSSIYDSSSGVSGSGGDSGGSGSRGTLNPAMRGVMGVSTPPEGLHRKNSKGSKHSKSSRHRKNSKGSKHSKTSKGSKGSRGRKHSQGKKERGASRV